MTYTPTQWHDGDTITAEKMNHLEQGVAQQQTGPAGPAGAPGAKGEKGEKGEKGDPGEMTAATKEKLGAVKQAAAIADIEAAPSQADFNGLLAKLRTAGILAQS